MVTVKISGQNNDRTAYSQSATVNEKTQDEQGAIDNNKQKKNTDTIYAADLKLGSNDIYAKKEQLKKNAIKILTDAFAGEQKIDEIVDTHRSNAEALKEEAKEAANELNRIKGLKQELKETYGIDGEGEEQKDKELFTEYQKAALEYQDMESTWRIRLDSANEAIANENRTIEAIQLDRLKTHPMFDARKDSQKILDAASREFAGGLLGEAKDNIDDTIEEDVDKAEEIKDKEKEKQEEASKAADKGSAQEHKSNTAPMEQAQKADADWDKLHREIMVMADKEKLLNEDLKGLTVDEQL